MESKKCKGCNIEFTADSKQQVFCNKQCCKHYFNNIEKQKSKKANGWIAKSKLEEEKQLKVRNLYLELQKTHLKASDIKQKYDVRVEYIERFCKKELNICLQSIVVNASCYNNQWRGGITRFYPLEIVKYIELYKSNNLPDGYVKQEYILEQLDIIDLTFYKYVKNFGDINEKRKYKNIPIYPKEKADEWINKIPILLKEAYKKQKLIRKQQSIEKKLIKNQLQKEKFTKWKQDIQERRTKERAEIEARKLARSMLSKKDRVIRRNDDWTSWENYEARLRKRLSDPAEVAEMRLEDAVENNKFYHSQHDIGNIIILTCKTCKNSKPYYEFHFDQTSKLGRRIKICKVCTNIKSNKNYKQGRKVKSADQFAIQFIISIKRELSKKNGYYYEIPIKKIWQALPFTKEELINHVTSLMQPWMNWDNNRRATVGLKTWHLDHIIPKSTFNYKSVDDEEFKKCWSLSNLRPIEAIVNLVKSNHKSLDSLVSSYFKRAVVRKLGSKMWPNYFDYSPQEAIEHLSKQFSEGMTWYNHGKIWEIDHIIPKAALPYNVSTDENFKKLWSLENLRPLLLSENRSKSSKHENKKHFINRLA